MLSVLAEAGVPAFLSAAAEDERRIANERRARNGQRPIAGGRPAKLSIIATLAVLLALRVNGYSPNLKTVARVLERGLTPGARRALGLPEIEPTNGEDRYAQVLSAWRRLSWLVDPNPLLSGRDRVLADEARRRLAEVDDEDKRRRLSRCFDLQNRVLDASLRVVHPSVMAGWDGSVAIDGTGVPVWGKRGNPRGTFNSKQPIAGDKLLSPEPWAGWYVREGDHLDDGKGRKEGFFGIDVHIATAFHATKRENMPRLVVAMAINTPGHAVGEIGADLLRSLHERGYPAGYASADRAYGPNALPDKYARPLWGLGYEPVMDYPVHSLGPRGTYGGALFIEGSLHTPGLPSGLWNISARYRAGEIDDAEYQRLLKQRAAFITITKAAPNETGTLRASCPAATKYPNTTCLIRTLLAQRADENARKKPKSLPLANSAQVDPNLPICTQGSVSVSFDDDNFARFYQPLQYQSKKWRQVYHGGRNQVEAMNHDLKSPHKGQIADPALRRMRGYGKQAIILALQVAATNILNYRAWLEANPERAERLDETNDDVIEAIGPRDTPVPERLARIDTLSWHPPEVPLAA